MQRNIEILGVTSLRGPNMWTYGPVLECLIDIGALEDFPSDRIPGFPERLAAWMPSLVEHRCSYDERGGFLRRLAEGTWPGHVLEHVVLELQTLAGMPGGFGRTRETPARGVYKMVVTSWHDDVTLAAVEMARDLVLAAMDGSSYDVAAAVARVRRMSDSLCLGPSTAAIAAGAEERKIPAIRLNDGNLVQLGYGSRQRRIWTAETDRTSAIGESISRDKNLTKQLLESCGVPVPQGRAVDSPEDAWDAALEVGLPVVVKPQDGNHGRGVFLGLATQAEIEKAYAVAQDEGSGVLVEQFIRGSEHRLLVVGDRMVAASRGDIAYVTGDGRSTVEALIESQLNSDPRRGATEDHPLNFVRIDAAARLELSHQGLEPHSAPSAGTRVLIQRNGNMAMDVTDEVHPDVARTVVLAARMVGLDIAGIDLVAEDIGRPLAEQNGAIVEVNAGPGLQFHLRPANGPGRPVGRAIVDHLFPAAEDGRIPVVGVAGSRDAAAVTLLIGHLLDLDGVAAGLACREGLYLRGRRIEASDATGWGYGRKLLMNRFLDAAVIESSARTLAAEGLAYDRCQVGIVMGIDAGDAMPERSIDTMEDLFKVFRTQIDVVLPGGTAVLNADDPAALEMAGLSDGRVVLIAASPDNPAIVRQRADGGCSASVRDGRITVSTGTTDVPIVHLSDVPYVQGPHMAPAVVRTLAAVAAAWSLGVPFETLRTGLETFDPACVTGTPPPN